jgi:hypothetical protein
MYLSEYWTKENRRIQNYSTHAALHCCMLSERWSMFPHVSRLFEFRKFEQFFVFPLYPFECRHDWSTIYIHVNYIHYSTILYNDLINSTFHSKVTSLPKLKFSPKKCNFSSCSCIQSWSWIDLINIWLSSTMYVHYIAIFYPSYTLVSITIKQFEDFSIFSNRCHVIAMSRMQVDDSDM